MKKILGLTVAALLVIGLVGGGTWAYFSDTEESTGNVFSSGTLDLGLANSGGTDPTGSVTATLWKSDAFRRMLTHLIGNRELAESLLSVPPLALYYGWLSFAFAPVLVMLTSSTIWKSNMPTQMKSAPLRKAHPNPSEGSMAPAARIL